MEQQKWIAIKKEQRDLIVTACKMANIDFEQECINSEAKECDKASESPWLTRQEAADYAKCSKDSIDGWLRNDFIQGSKLSDGRPGTVLIIKSSLEKFLKSKAINRKKRSGGYRVN